MTLSMYDASVVPFRQILNALSAILGKAADHCAEKKIDEAVFISMRLSPDMLPFSKQIQIATDHAKGAPGRLAGVELPVFPDTETSFAEFQARIAKTIAFLDTLTPEQVNHSEEKNIVLTLGKQTMTFKGQTYLINFALPNFYFHATTAYAILREGGLQIGKRDFVGIIPGL